MDWDGVELPTLELRVAAARELGETPERRHQALHQLRARIEALPYAARPDTGDAALLRVLRARKMDVEKAFVLARNLKAFEARYPQYFQRAAGERERFKAIAQSGVFSLLPGSGPQGHRMLALQFARTPLDDHKGDDIVAFLFWVAERLIRDPFVQVHGIGALSSYEGIGHGLFLKLFNLLPLSVRMEYNACYAARYGPICIFHAPFFVAAVFKLMKPFLPAKVKARVSFTSDYAAAKELYPDVSRLPPPFGTASVDVGSGMRSWVTLQLELEARGL